MSRYVIMLIILIPFVPLSAQFEREEDGRVSIDSVGLKDIVIIMTERGALMERCGIQAQEIIELKRILDLKDETIRLGQSETEFLMQTRDKAKPKWYDRFLIGFSAGILISVSLAFLK